MPINRTFGDFVDKKRRDALKELRLIGKLLDKKGLKVDNFLERKGDDDPYIFCHNPVRNSSFDGIRIYKIADKIAFRIQKESETHPYGRAYCLPIEDMFQDFLEDEDTSEEKAGTKVIEAVVKEIRTFFEKSAEVERDERRSGIDSEEDIAVRQSGSDYSSLINQKS